MKDVNIRKQFDPAFYIQRQAEQQKAIEWLEGNKRTLTVNALPANGKTWFLSKLRVEFRTRKVLTLWINVKDLVVEPGQRRGTNPTLNPQKTKLWLPKFVQQVQEESGQLHDFKANNDVTVTLEVLAKQLADYGSTSEQPICIFVDEGDEIRGLGWEEFEAKILEPLASKENIRFVIALRGDQRVDVFQLSYSADTLSLSPWTSQNDQHQGQQQLDVLKTAYPGYAAAVENLLTTLSAYKRTHPGINTFIHEFVQVNPAFANLSSLQDVDFLALFIKALNPQSPDNPQLIGRLLIKIMEFPQDEWAVDELAVWLGVSEIIGWEYIGLLRDNWLIENKDNWGKVIDEVREFVRALLNAGIGNNVPGDLNLLKRNKLFGLLMKHFDLDELRGLCFALGINFDDFGENRKISVKAMELIGYCERRGKIDALVAECQIQRPHILRWL